MKRAFLGIILAFLSASMLIVGLNTANGYATMQLQQDDSALMLHQYTFYNWQITAHQFVEYTDAFQIHYDASSTIMQSIHSLDPNYVGLLYRNVHKIDSTSPEWTEFASNNWVLKDQNGAYIYDLHYGRTYRIADIGNPNCQQWIADWIYNETKMHGYNGVFCDYGLNANVNEIWDGVSNRPINPRTGTFWTDQQVKDAYVGLLNKIRAKLGNNLLIIVNGIWDGEQWQESKSAYEYIIQSTDINGIMGEGWWIQSDMPQWYSEAKWKSSLDSLVELENYFVNDVSFKMFIPVCYVETEGISVLPRGTTETQMARYGFASTLLGIQSNRDYLLLTDNETLMADYYNTMFSNDIGYPIDNYSVVSDTHVYQRHYSKALVLVNPTDTPTFLHLDATFTNLDGQNVSGYYLMPAHTGEVLDWFGTGSPHASGGFQLPDLTIIAQAWESKPSDLNWNPNADLNGDGVVDLHDLVMLAQYYG